MSYEEKIKELKINLPEAKAPVGNYVATKVSGKMLFVSVQISIDESGQLIKGKIGKEITVNVGRFGPYLKCENKSARIESIDELFSIGLNRAITLISEAKPGRMSSSMIKDLGEHPEDKKPVRVMKGQYGPYIKYKSLNATIPEEKDPTELTMQEALILIEKRKEYDKTKKSKKRKSK